MERPGDALPGPHAVKPMFISGCDSSDCVLCHLHSISAAERIHAKTIPPSKRKRSLPCARGKTDLLAEPCGRESKRLRTHGLPAVFWGEGIATTLQQRKGWKWSERFAAYTAPAPASLAIASSNCGTEGLSEVVTALEFSPDGRHIIAGGVGKQIRLLSVTQSHEEPTMQPGLRLSSRTRMPGKISSLTWVPASSSCVAVGDYDGTLYVMHLGSGHTVAEVDAHAGRRVWSMHYSPLLPKLCVSASEDRTAKIWAGKSLEEHVATISPAGGGSICHAEFSNAQENTVALAASDHNVYLYDIRHLQAPTSVLKQHTKAVSYVKFLGPDRLISASTDGTLVCWDKSPGKNSSCSGFRESAGRGGDPNGFHVLRVFQGHSNDRHFVGLSVCQGEGLIACGSETPEVYAYHTSWGAPLASCPLSTVGGSATRALGSEQVLGVERGTCSNPFVSAVCWQPVGPATPQGTPLLAAATSLGDVKLLTLTED